MVYEVIKNRIDNGDIAEKHFGIPIQKRSYPSCYQYNVLIMLAKRLIKEDNRLRLDKKFVQRVFSSNKQESDLIF